ncbi:pca operon transcription factor PcaQ [Bordetella petrii]|uniref:pca operon transcription factor PcaQ n=1 Tax=Bordetella petrii TaxID=94624 RepID=UPI001E2D458E|nr:pca operon transcription factor PcaQ [Bordetella petrii]MCD0502939.1 pca operon transcription factor PcaQ [Bordetella petrii]
MENPFFGARIKFRHIQCFLAVAQSNSLQRAAERLSITQPAVSKTLSELESLLGVRLFERGRRGADLTGEGRRFAPYAHRCLDSLRDGIGQLSHADDEAAVKVSLGILPTVASVLLPTALRAFRQAWPMASLRVLTGRNVELLERLQAADIEFAVGRLGEPDAMAGMSFEHLFREPLTVVVRPGHALLAEDAFNPMAMARYPLIVPPEGTLIRQSAESIISALGLARGLARIECLSVSLSLELALQNDAVWFVPSSLVEPRIAHRVLVNLPVPSRGTDEPMGLLRRNDVAQSPAAVALLDALRQAGLQREQARIASA